MQSLITVCLAGITTVQLEMACILTMVCHFLPAIMIMTDQIGQTLRNFSKGLGGQVDKEGLGWPIWTYSHEALKKSEMKIRRRN